MASERKIFFLIFLFDKKLSGTSHEKNFSKSGAEKNEISEGEERDQKEDKIPRKKFSIKLDEGNIFLIFVSLRKE